MADIDVAGAALSLGNRIGRYFSLVSVVPALLLVLWVYALIVSGAWTHDPQLSAVTKHFGQWKLADAAWALVATFIVALFLHPLQFATTQLLEGYWGTSPAARVAMARRVLRHRERRSQLDQLEQHHQQAWHTAADLVLQDQYERDMAREYLPPDSPPPQAWTDETLEQRRTLLLDSDEGAHLMADVVSEDAAHRAWSRYPAGGRVMPTRLGNTLRRMEDSAGTQYGLHAIPIAPHLSLVAPDRHLAYLQDSRQQLDTTIRLCTVSLAAAVASVVVLLRDGLWLLVALVPYALAYIAYRGAVASAEEYGTAVSTVVDLDRFLLYEQLRVDQPRDAASERASNAALLRLLEGDASAQVRYRTDPDAEAPRHIPN